MSSPRGLPRLDSGRRSLYRGMRGECPIALGRVAAMPLNVNGCARSVLPLPREKRPQAAAVECDPGRLRNAAEVQQCRHDVD